ncbi:MAG: hypothetical protein F8N37_08395, partial [Telmatospirillum sp.]|nr:hypothetical protein [Telmatospirillum sp.]
MSSRTPDNGSPGLWVSPDDRVRISSGPRPRTRARDGARDGAREGDRASGGDRDRETQGRRRFGLFGSGDGDRGERDPADRSPPPPPPPP